MVPARAIRRWPSSISRRVAWLAPSTLSVTTVAKTPAVSAYPSTSTVERVPMRDADASEQEGAENEQAGDVGRSHESRYLDRVEVLVDHERVQADVHAAPGGGRTDAGDHRPVERVRLVHLFATGLHQQSDRRAHASFGSGSGAIAEVGGRPGDPVAGVLAHAGETAQGQRGGSGRHAGTLGDVVQCDVPCSIGDGAHRAR